MCADLQYHKYEIDIVVQLEKKDYDEAKKENGETTENQDKDMFGADVNTQVLEAEAEVSTKKCRMCGFSSKSSL